MYAREEEWDDRAGLFRGISTTVKANNTRLRHMLSLAEALVLNLSVSGELYKLSGKELRTRIERELNIRQERGAGATIIDYMEKAKRGKAAMTQQLYYYSQKRIKEFAGNKRVTDIDERWVKEYRDWLASSLSANTVRQELTRLSRAVNLAMEDGVATRNPVRVVKKPVAKVRKKSLSLTLLRQLRDMEIARPAQRMARDVFMLQFYLIGINIIDLYSARGIVDGRLEYIRHKTKQPYSVKVEPEAMEIIERLQGNGWLVDFTKYKTSVTTSSSMTTALKALIPGLSTNWARHTWATIAAELEIPIETTSHALGHQIGSPVTAIYVAFNKKKVDEANRRVIDYVNADLQKGKK